MFKLKSKLALESVAEVDELYQNQTDEQEVTNNDEVEEVTTETEVTDVQTDDVETPEDKEKEEEVISEEIEEPEDTSVEAEKEINEIAQECMIANEACVELEHIAEHLDKKAYSGGLSQHEAIYFNRVINRNFSKLNIKPSFMIGLESAETEDEKVAASKGVSATIKSWLTKIKDSVKEGLLKISKRIGDFVRDKVRYLGSLSKNLTKFIEDVDSKPFTIKEVSDSKLSASLDGLTAANLVKEYKRLQTTYNTLFSKKIIETSLDTIVDELIKNVDADVEKEVINKKVEQSVKTWINSWSKLFTSVGAKRVEGEGITLKLSNILGSSSITMTLPTGMDNMNIFECDHKLTEGNPEQKLLLLDNDVNKTRNTLTEIKRISEEMFENYKQFNEFAADIENSFYELDNQLKKLNEYDYAIDLMNKLHLNKIQANLPTIHMLKVVSNKAEALLKYFKKAIEFK